MKLGLCEQQLVHLARLTAEGELSAGAARDFALQIRGLARRAPRHQLLADALQLAGLLERTADDADLRMRVMPAALEAYRTLAPRVRAARQREYMCAGHLHRMRS